MSKSQTLCVTVGKATVKMVNNIKVIEYDHKILQQFVNTNNKKGEK